MHLSFLANFYSARFRAKKTHSSSEFSKSPFAVIEATNNIEFAQKLIKDGIIKVVGEEDPVIGKLIKFAKDRDTDSHVSEDTFLHSLINPSRTLGDQPSHDYIGYKSLDKVEGVVVIEAPVWSRFKDRTVISGHIDIIIIKDGVIYICDYKPNVKIPLSPDSNRYSFINSIPQIAAYAFILKKMFGYTDIKCVTFNQDAACIYDPEQALDECIEHYDDNVGEKPTWAILTE